MQQRENRKMQSVLGLGSKFMLPKDAQKKLDEAIATKDEIHKKYKEKLKVCSSFLLHYLLFLKRCFF